MIFRVLHEFLWLLRARWVQFIGCALLWVVESGTDWLNAPQSMRRLDALWFAASWPVLLAGWAGAAKPALEKHAAWLTRPPAWQEVWCAQLLFCAALAAVPATCMACTGLQLGHTSEHWLRMTQDALAYFGILTAAAAFGSLAVDNLRAPLLCTLGGVLAGGIALLDYLASRGIQGFGRLWGVERDILIGLAGALAGISGFLALWGLALWRKALAWRDWALAAGWMLLAPALLWMTSIRHVERCGMGRESLWAQPASQSWLRGQFPAGTRFYVESHSARWGDALRLPMMQLAADADPARHRPLPPLDIPLTEGAEASGGGSRIRLTRLRSDSTMLELQLSGLHASPALFPGIALTKSSLASGVYVLTFPSEQLAIVLQPDYWNSRTDARSFRHVAETFDFTIPLPDAEALRNMRWTQEVLAGARLYYFDITAAE